jgi:hypothetical protein
VPDLKISELTEDTTPETTDTVPLRRSTSNYRATVAQIVGSLFSANQVVKADAAGVVSALTVAEQTLVGRITSGVITALTATQVRTLLNVADGATANPNAVEATSTFGTDNRVLRSDSTSRLAQSSGVTIDDADNVTGVTLINSQRVPDGAGTAATGTTHSATSTDDNRVIECSNASGCTVSVNSGTAGSWRAYFASASSQTVTIQKGTLTTLYVPPTYDQGSSSFTSEERYALVGVFYLTSSVGIAFGRMVAA